MGIHNSGIRDLVYTQLCVVSRLLSEICHIFNDIERMTFALVDKNAKRRISHQVNKRLQLKMLQLTD